MVLLLLSFFFIFISPSIKINFINLKKLSEDLSSENVEENIWIMGLEGKKCENFVRFLLDFLKNLFFIKIITKCTNHIL